MSQPHIPRPKNAFIFFRSHYLRVHREEENQNVISCAAGLAWHALSAEGKEPFRELARLEKERHKVKYPEYKNSTKKRSGGGSGGARKGSRSSREPKNRRSKASSSQSPTPSLTSSASSLSTPPPRTPSPSRAPSVPPSSPVAPRIVKKSPSGRAPVIPSSVAISLRGNPRRDVPEHKFSPIAPLPPLSAYEVAHDDWTPGYESSLTMPLNFDYDVQYDDDVDMATGIDWDSLQSPFMFGEERCSSSSKGKVLVTVSRKENTMDFCM